jgi:hypothetical protein
MYHNLIAEGHKITNVECTIMILNNAGGNFATGVNDDDL